ncbi:MAG: hypothetical protein GY696_15435 [Gammaproteobacteria bacterium]|nr:hypothetical protein [Gammaproteobacteria bacterium]
MSSFLDNYRGAENARRLLVYLWDNGPAVSDILGELGNLLWDVRKSLGVAGELVQDLTDFNDLLQNIEKKDFVLRRRVAVKFVIGNAECLVKVDKPQPL